MSTGAAEPRTSIGASSPNRFVRTPQPPRRRLGSRPRLPEPSDAAIRKLTGEILARPEFASAISKEPFWTEWLRTFLKWLQKIQLLHDTSPVLYWTIVAHTERRWFGRREDDPEIYTQWLSAFERLSAELR